MILEFEGHMICLSKYWLIDCCLTHSGKYFWMRTSSRGYKYYSDMKEERDNWGNIGLPPEKYGTVENERKL